MKSIASRRAPAKSRQQGVVLLIALIALVAMTLAALGLVRSIDTGTLVAGNIGFRQTAVASADAGVEAARTWLLTGGGGLSDNPGMGYYSTRQDSLDLTGNKTEGGSDGVNWNGSDSTQPVASYTVGTDASGNTVMYLIHRLCSQPGSINATNQTCAYMSISSTGSTQKLASYPDYALATKNQVYIRVTVRVNGPKNTVSYVQAILLM